jgi:hypothetical protein
MRRDKESSDRTVSLEDQRARIASYCAERDGVLAETLADDGVPGGNRERLSFSRARGTPVWRDNPCRFGNPVFWG